MNEQMRELTNARLRRNYGLVQTQLGMAYEQGNAHAMQTLMEWERGYLDELVRRGIQA